MKGVYVKVYSKCEEVFLPNWSLKFVSQSRFLHKLRLKKINLSFEFLSVNTRREIPISDIQFKQIIEQYKQEENKRTFGNIDCNVIIHYIDQLRYDMQNYKK